MEETKTSLQVLAGACGDESRHIYELWVGMKVGEEVDEPITIYPLALSMRAGPRRAFSRRALHSTAQSVVNGIDIERGAARGFTGPGIASQKAIGATFKVMLGL